MQPCRQTLDSQAGVISREQVLALGPTDNDVDRWLRRRVWARVHPGVYVDHTGPLTWEQRAWAAVLARGPALLGGSSALRAHGVRSWTTTVDDADPIELVVDASRRVQGLIGARISRASGLDAAAQFQLSPPRVRIEHALLHLASRARNEVDRVAVLADGCQSRRTTAARLRDQLRCMSRLPGRRLMLAILEDVAAGVCSTLEHRFLVDVERAHGLPVAKRQRRVGVPGRNRAYCDVRYVGLATVVELDGRLGHEWAEGRCALNDRGGTSAA